MKICINLSNKANITSSENQKVISKTNTSEAKLLTSWVILEACIIFQLNQTYVKIFHAQNKKVRRNGIPPCRNPFLALKRLCKVTVNIKSVGNNGQTFHYPLNKLKGETQEKALDALKTATRHNHTPFEGLS